MSDLHVTQLGGPRVHTASLGVTAASATAVLAGLALSELLLHLTGIRHYGFFRDELYYMACGEHLAWGYIDQPPLIAFAAWFARHFFGSSIVALRIFPVLAGAIAVFLTGILAREMDGGILAQFLAALGILLAPAYLAFDSFFSMNAFEPVFWLGCAWIAVRIVKGAPSRWWIAFGALAGIGLENKHTMLVFGFALVAGLLLSGEWRVFRSPWIWIGAAFAFLIFLPNLLWEAHHGWPQFEVVRNAQLYKNVAVSPLDFMGEQIAFMHPLAFPLWLAGLAWLFFSAKGKRFRFLGWAYFVVLAIFIIFDGKSYYALPVYPMVMAAGGVAFEDFTGERRRWTRAAYPALLIIGGMVAVPFGVPLLPIDSFIRYSRLLPYSTLAKTERDATAVELPQLYADMFGWDDTASTVARVYWDLPAADRADCAILGGNYGEAGAIDYYGPALGLPKAISGHNSYWDWGPRGYSGSCMIIFGERSEKYIQFFGDVRVAGTITSSNAMPNERSVPVYVCRKPREPLSALWPEFRMII